MANNVVVALVLLALALGAVAAPAAEPVRALRADPILVTGGLDSPRGLALGSGGEIYIADSGAAARPGSGRVVRVGPDGALTPLLSGAANATGTPHGETYIFGLSDVAVQGDGLLITVGVGSGVSGQGGGPNRLVRLGPSGGLAELFDLERFERERDPDGRGPGSNATGIAVAPDGGLWLSDAGGNWVARLADDGQVRAVVAFPMVDGQEAVPTGLAIGPDGELYVALFRCLVPTAGKGGVARVKADGSWEIVAAGFSNPIDVAFDAAGALHVLEFATDYAPDSGRLVRVGAGGQADVLLDGLNYPTSLAIAASGTVYLTQMAAVSGGGPGTGKLVRFDPISP